MYYGSIDFGTTVVKGRLKDDQGRTCAETSVLNRQGHYGADVISRMQCSVEGMTDDVRSAGAETIRELAAELARKAGCQVSEISHWGFAANTPLSCLMAGVPVAPLLAPPFTLPDRLGRLVDGSGFGLGESARVYTFPLINAFVGGDLVAFLFAQPAKSTPTIYIDFGTNAEVAITRDGAWWVTSVAAGPAFEGGEISTGMLHADGAVEGVTTDGDRLQLAVVGNVLPKGLCGTGLADLIAVGLDQGLVDAQGGLRSPDAVASNLCRYLVETGQGRHFRYYRDARTSLELTQEDIRQFQYAKAAVHAGVRCLLERAGVEEADVQDIVFTGAFGRGLEKETIKTVALLPESMVDRVSFSPEGALCGIEKFLTEGADGEALMEFAGQLRPSPLSGTPKFEQAFIEAMDF